MAAAVGQSSVSTCPWIFPEANGDLRPSASSESLNSGSFRIGAEYSTGWESGWENKHDIAGLHQPQFNKDSVAQILNKAGYRPCPQAGEGGVKHKSFWDALQQFSEGGRSDALHQKGLNQAKALMMVRLLLSLLAGKTINWDRVAAAFKRTDYLSDRTMQGYLIASNQPEEGDEAPKTAWGKIRQRFGAGRIAAALLRTAHVFTGICESTSAPHGFLFRDIMNAIGNRNLSSNSARYAVFTAVITMGLGILIETAYKWIRSSSESEVSWFSKFIGFPLFCGVCGLTAGVLRFVAMPFILLAKVDFNNKNLQKILLQEAEVDLYQIDVLMKTLVYNLQEQEQGGKTLAVNTLLSEQGNNQGNAYRTVCKAMQRKVSGYQLSRVGRSTNVGNSTLVEKLCSAYYDSNSALALDKVNTGTRLAALMHLIGEHLSKNAAANDTTETASSKIAQWGKAKLADRAHSKAECELVFLRELAIGANRFNNVDDGMSEEQKVFLLRRKQSVADRKDLRLQVEAWCKELNKKGLLFLAKLFSRKSDPNTFMLNPPPLSLRQSLVKWLSDAADDDVAAEKLAKKLADPRRYAHHSDVMMANIDSYAKPIQILRAVPKILTIFNFSYVLAVHAQSSRGYASLLRWVWRKVTESLPSVILCTNLGRFFGGLQVSGFTFGLGAAAMAAGAVIKYGFAAGNMALSLIITGTSMAMLAVLCLPFILLAKALVYFNPDKYYKGGAKIKTIDPSRIKNFTFKPLPAHLMPR